MGNGRHRGCCRPVERLRRGATPSASISFDSVQSLKFRSAVRRRVSRNPWAFGVAGRRRRPLYLPAKFDPQRPKIAVWLSFSLLSALSFHPAFVKGLRHLRRLCLAALLIAAAWPALAEPVWTAAPSTMRRAPRPTARIVQEVPPNAQILLQNCRGDWCYASWRNRSGYIPAYAVNVAPPPGASPPQPIAGGGGSFELGPPSPPPSAPVWGGPYVGMGWGWNRW